MKKRIGLFLCLTVTALLSACGGENAAGRFDNKPAGVNDVLEAGIAEAEAGIAEAEAGIAEAEAGITEAEVGDEAGNDEHQSGVNEGAPVPEDVEKDEAAVSNAEGIDVDLTTLSATMVYSEVYSMLVAPEKYIGKTVKMKGAFTGYHDEKNDKYYFACIIKDATACCSQGIEFVLTDDYVYPDDYPEEGETITVVGTFENYMEDKYRYCTLKEAELVSLDTVS